MSKIPSLPSADPALQSVVKVFERIQNLDKLGTRASEQSLKNAKLLQDVAVEINILRREESLLSELKAREEAASARLSELAEGSRLLETNRCKLEASIRAVEEREKNVAERELELESQVRAFAEMVRQFRGKMEGAPAPALAPEPAGRLESRHPPLVSVHHH